MPEQERNRHGKVWTRIEEHSVAPGAAGIAGFIERIRLILRWCAFRKATALSVSRACGGIGALSRRLVRQRARQGRDH